VKDIYDWMWSIDAVGYAPRDPISTFQELVRVMKPGGGLILGFRSSQCLPPGYFADETGEKCSPIKTESLGIPICESLLAKSTIGEKQYI
jgi:hypothetical protein